MVRKSKIRQIIWKKFDNIFVNNQEFVQNLKSKFKQIIELPPQTKLILILILIWFQFSNWYDRTFPVHFVLFLTKNADLICHEGIH